jgi:hypothetical protein
LLPDRLQGLRATPSFPQTACCLAVRCISPPYEQMHVDVLLAGMASSLRYARSPGVVQGPWFNCCACANTQGSLSSHNASPDAFDAESSVERCMSKAEEPLTSSCDGSSRKCRTRVGQSKQGEQSKCPIKIQSTRTGIVTAPMVNVAKPQLNANTLSCTQYAVLKSTIPIFFGSEVGLTHVAP